MVRRLSTFPISLCRQNLLNTPLNSDFEQQFITNVSVCLFAKRLGDEKVKFLIDVLKQKYRSVWRYTVSQESAHWAGFPLLSSYMETLKNSTEASPSRWFAQIWGQNCIQKTEKYSLCYQLERPCPSFWKRPLGIGYAKLCAKEKLEKSQSCKMLAWRQKEVS